MADQHEYDQVELLREALKARVYAVSSVGSPLAELYNLNFD